MAAQRLHTLQGPPASRAHPSEASTSAAGERAVAAHRLPPPIAHISCTCIATDSGSDAGSSDGHPPARQRRLPAAAGGGLQVRSRACAHHPLPRSPPPAAQHKGSANLQHRSPRPLQARSRGPAQQQDRALPAGAGARGCSGGARRGGRRQQRRERCRRIAAVRQAAGCSFCEPHLAMPVSSPSPQVQRAGCRTAVRVSVQAQAAQAAVKEEFYEVRRNHKCIHTRACFLGTATFALWGSKRKPLALDWGEAAWSDSVVARHSMAGVHCPAGAWWAAAGRLACFSCPFDCASSAEPSN